jgi:uncharacterized membrane protein
MTHASRDLNFERTVFFSDAVFAIAITLLILDVKLPHGKLPFGEALGEAAPQIFGFLLSFMVIGIYWVNHTRIFARLEKVTPGIMRLNMLLLLTVSFLPFPTSVIAERGSETWVVIFYALSVAALGLAHFALAWLSLRGETARRDLTAYEHDLILWRSLITPILFVASAFVALGWPGWSMLMWAMIPNALLAVAMITRRVHARRAKQESAA